MKKLSVLVCSVLFAMASFAQDPYFDLVVPATHTGYVDASTVDLADLGEGDYLTLELHIKNNTGFLLSAFEIEVVYPKYLILMDTNQIGTSNAPFTIDTSASGWATTNVQKLPATDAGEDDDATYSNPDGKFRCGVVITASGDRTGASERDFVLATLRFRLGRGMSSALADRSAPLCRSFAETIEVTIAGNDRAIIADDAASAVSFDTSQVAAAKVTLNDSSLLYPRGDATLDGATDFINDLLPAARCLILGPTNSNCVLNGETSDLQIQILDYNCSTAYDFSGDALLGIKDIVGITRSASKSKRQNNANVDVSGAGIANVNVPGKAIMSVGSVKGNGLVNGFSISEADQANGWTLVSTYHSNTDTFRWVVFKNDLMTPGRIPTVMVDYSTSSSKASLNVFDTVLLDDAGARFVAGKVR